MSLPQFGGQDSTLGPQRRVQKSYSQLKPYERPHSMIESSSTSIQPNTSSLLSSVRSIVTKPFSWLGVSRINNVDVESNQHQSIQQSQQANKSELINVPPPPPKIAQRPHSHYNDIPFSFTNQSNKISNNISNNHLTIPSRGINDDNRLLSASYSPRLSSSFGGRSRSPFTPVRSLMPGSPAASPRRSLLSTGRNASPLISRARYRTPNNSIRKSPNTQSNVQSILANGSMEDEGDFNPYAHSKIGDKRTSTPMIEPSSARPSKRRATDISNKIVYSHEADEFMSLEEARARKPQPPAPKNEAEKILLALEKMRTPLTDARKSNPLSARSPLPSSSSTKKSPLGSSINVPVPSVSYKPKNVEKVANVDKRTETMISPYARSKQRREDERRERERELKTSKLSQKLPKPQKPKNVIAAPTSDDEDEDEDNNNKISNDVNQNVTEKYSLGDSAADSKDLNNNVATTSAAKLFGSVKEGKDEFKPGERGQSATERARSSLRARTMTSSRQHTSAARNKASREDSSKEEIEEEEEHKRKEERDALKSVPVVSFNFGSQPSTQPSTTPSINLNLPKPEQNDNAQKKESKENDVDKKENIASTPKPSSAFSFGNVSNMGSTTPKLPPPSSSLLFGGKKDEEKKNEEKKDEHKPSQPSLPFTFGAPKPPPSEEDKKKEEKAKEDAAQRPNPFALFEANNNKKDEEENRGAKESEKKVDLPSFGDAKKEDENEKKDESRKVENKFSFGALPSLTAPSTTAATSTPAFGSAFSKPSTETTTTNGFRAFGSTVNNSEKEEKKHDSDENKSSTSLFDRLGDKPLSASPFGFNKVNDEKKEDEKKSASPFSTPFSFGKPSNEDKEEKKEEPKQPTFSFGTFGKPDENDKKKEDNKFSFGVNTSNKTEESKPLEFSSTGVSSSPATAFGKPSKDDNNNKPVFSFGTPISNTNEENKPKGALPPTTSSPFTFGAPDDNKPKPPTSTSSPFTFGATPSKDDNKSKPQQGSPFTFGTSSNAPASSPFGQTSTSTEPTKPSTTFSFGTPTSGTENKQPQPFAFGGSQSSLFGGSGDGATSKPAFSFGSPAATTTTNNESKAPFAFGTPTNDKSVENKTTTTPFGGFGNTTSNSVGGFTFGGSGSGFGSGAGGSGTAFGKSEPQTNNGGGDSMEESPTRPSAPQPGPGPTNPFGSTNTMPTFSFGQPSTSSNPFGSSSTASTAPSFGFGQPSQPQPPTSASTFTFGNPTPSAPAPAPAAPALGNPASQPTSPFTFGQTPSNNIPTPQSPSLFNIGTGSPAPGTPNSQRQIKPLRKRR